MRWYWLLLVLVVIGCGSLLPEPTDERAPDPACMARCDGFDNSYLAWKTVGIVGSAIGGAAGTAGAFVEGFADEEDSADWSLGLLITGGIGGIMATAGNWLAGEYADRTSECIAACGGR